MYQKKVITLALLLTGCTLICGAASQLDVSLSKADLPGSSDIPPADDIAKKTTSTTTTTVVPPPQPDTTSTSSTTSTTTTTTTTPIPTTSTSTTTTTPAPTTTTAAPNTTTPSPITTTPAPAPYPDPSVGTWNGTCILLKMAAQLNFTYETKDNKTATALYNVPADAEIYDAHCDMNLTEFLQLNWDSKIVPHSLLMQFDMANNSARMVMVHIILPLTGDRFPNAKENQTVDLIHRGIDFNAPAQMSYHCTRAQKLNLTNSIESNSTVGTITFSDVQVEAFRKANATGFSTVHDCDSSETSDIVPIAVGIALAALILIVLISYLCARRRSTLRGYMSF